MISDRYRCIFIHLRRTGGNSIESALGGIRLLDRSGNATQVWDNELHRGKTPYKIDLRGHFIHDTAEDVQQKVPEKFQTYFKFSFVRNPWAQMLSIFFRKHGSKGMKGDFGQFLIEYRKQKGTVPRVSLYDEEGRQMIDFIGRFENLAEDFEMVAKKVGLEAGGLPRHNVSAEVDYRAFYTDDLAELVARRFRDDIATFGYTF